LGFKLGSLFNLFGLLDENIKATENITSTNPEKEEQIPQAQKHWYSPVVDAFKATGSFILGIATGLIDTLLLPLNIVLDIAINKSLDVSFRLNRWK